MSKLCQREMPSPCVLVEGMHADLRWRLFHSASHLRISLPLLAFEAVGASPLRTHEYRTWCNSFPRVVHDQALSGLSTRHQPSRRSLICVITSSLNAPQYNKPLIVLALTPRLRSMHASPRSKLGSLKVHESSRTIPIRPSKHFLILMVSGEWHRFSLKICKMLIWKESRTRYNGHLL